MFAVIAVSLRAVEEICNVVYQARFFNAEAYKTGTSGLHSHGAMGTDAAINIGASHRQLQSKRHHSLNGDLS
jgi:hypothetical protein